MTTTDFKDTVGPITAKRTARQDNINRLRQWFPKGSTVYTILRHVSESGMTRHIGIVSLQHDGEKLYDWHPNLAVASALGARQNKRGDGVIVSGCGMDMGFHLVSNLAQVLYDGDYKALEHRWL